jgi:hypothetical protein
MEMNDNDHSDDANRAASGIGAKGLSSLIPGAKPKASKKVTLDYGSGGGGYKSDRSYPDYGYGYGGYDDWRDAPTPEAKPVMREKRVEKRVEKPVMREQPVMGRAEWMEKRPETRRFAEASVASATEKLLGFAEDLDEELRLSIRGPRPIHSIDLTPDEAELVLTEIMGVMLDLMETAGFVIRSRAATVMLRQTMKRFLVEQTYHLGPDEKYRPVNVRNRSIFED